MGFSNFVGNPSVTRQLREAIAAGRLPQAIILNGSRGSGKYTLAIMLAQAINCKLQPLTGGLPDFCGTCTNCTRIATAQPLADRVAEAVSAREELRETDKKETRILVQPHPDLLIIPPDPPQLLIKLGQVRSVIRGIYRMPSDARRAIELDLPAYLAGRQDALTLLRHATTEADHSTLFRMTETYRAGADGAEKTTALLRATSSLLEDMLLIQAGVASLIRNIDLRPELDRMAGAVSHAWIESASRGLDQVESGMRRNLLRSLTLDSFASSIDRPR